MFRVCFALLLSFLFSTAFAQNFSGIVVDGNNLPLSDVYLFNNRSKIHTLTDDAGIFNLRSCMLGDSIRFIAPGFNVLTVAYSFQRSKIKLIVKAFQIDDVVVTAGANQAALLNLRIHKGNSTQELLRSVPGLFGSQTAGAGKAEQLFLRGFDMGFGSDINIIVDHVPVNLVSHAHGQGYADLNFLIPETVDKIDFDKGPFHADKGNLATAGYVAFKTKDRLNANTVTLEGGKFNTFRALGLFNIVNNERQSAYIGAEYRKTDGFLEAPQDYKKLNLIGKYSYYFKNLDQLTFSASHFKSDWNASGQIPQDAVNQDLITRFGAVDSSQGGKTSRSSLALNYNKFIDDDTWLKSNFYFNRNKFELYSNYSFYLNDPINGDQIKQKETRNLLGLESVLHKKYSYENSDLNLQTGVGVRYDDVEGSELSQTVNRTNTLSRIELGDIDEVNPFAFVSAAVDFGKLILNPELRVDLFTFRYQDLLERSVASRFKSIVSPKLNFTYNQNQNLQFNLKLGKGFHTNDSRVSVTPRGEFTMPSVYGVDLGSIWKPIPRLMVNTALWYLYLENEFVYLNHVGIVESKGRSSRKGIDFGLQYQLNNWLFLHSNATYTYARLLDAPEEQYYVSLAPKYTFTGGLSVKQYHNFSGSVNVKYLGRSAANADNSITTKPYAITNANVNYSWKQFTLGIIAENIFNQIWNDAQFVMDSKLKTETSPTTGINFTPGTPLNVRASLSVNF